MARVRRPRPRSPAWQPYSPPERPARRAHLPPPCPRAPQRAGDQRQPTPCFVGHASSARSPSDMPCLLPSSSASRRHCATFPPALHLQHAAVGDDLHAPPRHQRCAKLYRLQRPASSSRTASSGGGSPNVKPSTFKPSGSSAPVSAPASDGGDSREGSLSGSPGLRSGVVVEIALLAHFLSAQRLVYSRREIGRRKVADALHQ